ncbi:MAG TPA: hypothetical protein VFA07_12915 [Chthonomonadaceae bacterium]|nr:hypothetical protein [Chthonomonadaceae bacterium]
MKLLDYYQIETARQALDRYYKEYGQVWDLPTKLKRYNDVKEAFVLEAPLDQRQAVKIIWHLEIEATVLTSTIRFGLVN